MTGQEKESMDSQKEMSNRYGYKGVLQLSWLQLWRYDVLKCTNINAILQHQFWRHLEYRGVDEAPFYSHSVLTFLYVQQKVNFFTVLSLTIKTLCVQRCQFLECWLFNLCSNCNLLLNPEIGNQFSKQNINFTDFDRLKLSSFCNIIS